MTQRGRVPSTKPDNLNSTLGPRRWRERTNSCKLSSDLHTYSPIPKHNKYNFFFFLKKGYSISLDN